MTTDDLKWWARNPPMWKRGASRIPPSPHQDPERIETTGRTGKQAEDEAFDNVYAQARARNDDWASFVAAVWSLWSHLVHAHPNRSAVSVKRIIAGKLGCEVNDVTTALDDAYAWYGDRRKCE